MAKNKNKSRKYSNQHPNQRQLVAAHKALKTSISKTQFERGCSIAHKMFRLLGLDPAVFDGFTKKQKLFLLNNESQPPLIDVEPGCFVPRQYLNRIRTEMYACMQTEYVDEETKFTLIELITYGIPMLLMLEIGIEKNMFVDSCLLNQGFADFCNGSKEDRITLRPRWLVDLYSCLDFQMSLYSQMNFRIYGYNVSFDIIKPQIRTGFGTMRIQIKINSIESESIYFNHNGVSRKAFRVMAGDNFESEAAPIFIWRSKLFPENTVKDRPYFMYIQSHVLQRFKERMDIFETTNRNHLLYRSIIIRQNIVQSSDGQPMLVCSIGGNTLGYFPFIIQGDKLFILSFLPFVSAICPEGAKLHQLLGLHKEDIKHLGMDKMSFYVLIDFEQIPMLRDALQESGIWKTKIMLDESCIESDGFDQVKTSFVKNFFQKLALRNATQFPEDNPDIV
ncbi:MAG: hypothetical protein LBD59_03310 [Prevotellaceae bacterium]|jgi:hypothetical protein|nr:hypothetical protein [Prevotellaceae bacterium]